MSTGLIEIMKRAAIDAQEAGQPCDLRTGTVKTVSPLSIQVSSQLILPEGLLIVPEKLKDYTMEVTLDWTTEPIGNHTHDYSGSCSDGGSHSGTTNPAGTHTHQILSGKSKTITIHNALKVGDKVALIRKHGGQFFYILDRI
jgi:hypothetical protein